MGAMSSKFPINNISRGTLAKWWPHHLSKDQNCKTNCLRVSLQVDFQIIGKSPLRSLFDIKHLTASRDYLFAELKNFQYFSVKCGKHTIFCRLLIETVNFYQGRLSILSINNDARISGVHGFLGVYCIYTSHCIFYYINLLIINDNIANLSYSVQLSLLVE